MMVAQIIPQETDAYSLPLPLYGMVKIGTIISRDNDEFTVWVGADEDVVRQLKEKSLDVTDTDIQENTSDLQRFGEGSYEEWYRKERTPFSLIHTSTKQLAAFVWLGQKPLGRKSLKYLSDDERAKEGEQKDDVWHTLVYRSYIPFRGKGLMGDFVDFALKAYREHYPDAKLWVGLSANNPASAALAKRLGFVARDDLFDAEKNWMAMSIE